MEYVTNSYEKIRTMCSDVIPTSLPDIPDLPWETLTDATEVVAVCGLVPGGAVKTAMGASIGMDGGLSVTCVTVSISAALAAYRYWVAPSEARQDQMLSTGRKVGECKHYERFLAAARSLEAPKDRKENAAHTHPKSAAKREAARGMVELLCQQIKRSKFNYQESLADQEKSLRSTETGVRTYYWKKDLRAEVNRGLDNSPWWDWIHPSPLNAPPFSLSSLVDIDYYVNLRDYFAMVPKVHALYTFNLEHIANGEGDLTWTPMKDGDFKFQVAGATEFKHRLYEFGQDSVIAYKPSFGFGLFKDWNNGKLVEVPECTVYSVVSKPLGDSRTLVIFVPSAHYEGFAAWQAVSKFGCEFLKHLDPIVRESGFDPESDEPVFARLKISTPKGLMTSTCIAGDNQCITIPTVVDNAVCAFKHTQPQVSVTTVKQTVNKSDTLLGKFQIDNTKSIVLAAFIKKTNSKANNFSISTIYPGTDVHRLQFNTYDDGGKKTIFRFANLPIDGLYAHDETMGNTYQSINARVTFLRPGAYNAPPTGRVTRELIEPLSYENQCTVQDVCTWMSDKTIEENGEHLEPFDLDTLIEHVDRKPSQRAQLKKLLELDCTDDELHRVLARAFTKKEASATINDPRAITDYSAGVARKFEVLCFAIPLMNNFKTIITGCVSGRQPCYVDEQMVNIATRMKEFGCNADAHRLDGTINSLIRDIIHLCNLSVYKDDYAEELTNMKHDQTHHDVRASFNLAYELVYELGSGSGLTTYIGNVSMFFVYVLALKRAYNCDTLTAIEFVNTTVAFSSDDSCVVDLDPKHLEWGSKQLGLIFGDGKIEKIPIGEPGMSLLNRVYTSEITEGCKSSHCSIVRQLSKFFTTRIPNGDPKTLLILKALAYVSSDRNTPLLGPLCRKVLVLAAAEQQTVEPSDLNEKSFCEESYLDRSNCKDTLTLNLPDNVIESSLPYLLPRDLNRIDFDKVVITIDRDVQFCNDWHGDFHVPFDAGGELDGFDEKRWTSWLSQCTSLTQLLATVPTCLILEPSKLYTYKECVSLDGLDNEQPDTGCEVTPSNWYSEDKLPHDVKSGPMPVETSKVPVKVQAREQDKPRPTCRICRSETFGIPEEGYADCKYCGDKPSFHHGSCCHAQVKSESAWSEHVAPTGHTYYYNSQTKESRWQNDKPCLLDPDLSAGSESSDNSTAEAESEKSDTKTSKSGTKVKDKAKPKPKSSKTKSEQKQPTKGKSAKNKMDKLKSKATPSKGQKNLELRQALDSVVPLQQSDAATDAPTTKITVVKAKAKVIQEVVSQKVGRTSTLGSKARERAAKRNPRTQEGSVVEKDCPHVPSKATEKEEKVITPPVTKLEETPKFPVTYGGKEWITVPPRSKRRETKMSKRIEQLVGPPPKAANTTSEANCFPSRNPVVPSRNLFEVLVDEYVDARADFAATTPQPVACKPRCQAVVGGAGEDNKVLEERADQDVCNNVKPDSEL